MKIGPDAVERGAMTFLADSVVLAIRSEDDDADFSSSLSRASILASAQYIEACANTCLDTLKYEIDFIKDIERLPTLSKFELFSRLEFSNRPLDRGRNEILDYLELKKIRDSYVHPKSQKIIWESWTETSSISESPRTKRLNLPKIASFCSNDDAINALRATHGFLRYFFHDICRYSGQKVSALLCSEDPTPNLSDQITHYWDRRTLDWVKTKRIDLSYVRIGKL